MEEKKCNVCGRVLPLDAFHKCSSSKDGRQSMCKECRSIYDKSKRKTLSDGTLRVHKVYSSPELAKFTPRQLMEELKSRGYRWDYMTEPVRKILFDKI